MNQATRSYIAEFIGTFTLVFVGTAVATLQGMLGQGPVGWLGISMAFGGTLMVLVLVIGPVSGCHVNPAVTVPMALSGRLKWPLVPGYLVAQFTGALAAGAVLLALLKGFSSPEHSVYVHGLGENGNPQKLAVWALFMWEMVLTALFLLTIFSVTRSDAPPGAAAPAIGGFLFVAHLVGAPLGDSSLNPARSFGPAMWVAGDSLKILWVFIVGPLVGGVIGYLLYLLIHPKE